KVLARFDRHILEALDDRVKLRHTAILRAADLDRHDHVFAFKLTAYVDADNVLGVLVKPRPRKAHVRAPQHRLAGGDDAIAFDEESGPARLGLAARPGGRQRGEVHDSINGNRRNLLAEMKQVHHHAAKWADRNRLAARPAHGHPSTYGTPS